MLSNQHTKEEIGHGDFFRDANRKFLVALVVSSSQAKIKMVKVLFQDMSQFKMEHNLKSRWEVDGKYFLPGNLSMNRFSPFCNETMLVNLFEQDGKKKRMDLKVGGQGLWGDIWKTCEEMFMFRSHNKKPLDESWIIQRFVRLDPVHVRVFLK